LLSCFLCHVFKGYLALESFVSELPLTFFIYKISFS